MSKTETTTYEGMPSLGDVHKWLNAMEEQSLSHGVRDLDGELYLIAACRTYLKDSFVLAYQRGLKEAGSDLSVTTETTNEIYSLRTEDLNALQIKSLKEVLALAKSGTRFTDVIIRKDGLEYRFEADWLQNLQTDMERWS